MAAKTTKKTAQVKEEIEKPVETVEQPTEEKTEIPVDETMSEKDNIDRGFTRMMEKEQNQAEEATEADPPVEYPSVEPEPVVEPESAEEEPTDTIVEENLLKVAEDVKKKAEELSEINEVTPETMEAIKSEINRIDNIEKELEADIKNSENELKRKNPAVEKLFKRGFNDYWNGVSDGWNN